MDGEEPTQATQNVLDPRRVGKQNSGFSDDDISDIICVLYPNSDSARQEVQRLALEDSPHIIGRDEADGVEPDYDLEDHASRFESNPAGHGNYAIILRLSSQVKNPSAGFAFGRNSARCDVVFTNDPLRRVSNIHFRIYVNEYGNVMVEDQSTNGTFVDRNLLTSHPKDKSRPAVTKWVLSSGTVIKIFLHDEIRDLSFRVRIPRRDDEYDRVYINKVEDYFARHALPGNPQPTIGTGPGGHVDLFKTTGQPAIKRVGFDPAEAQLRSPSKRRGAQSVMGREWTGSGSYNRIGTIGKGAFAVVYKVTSKYDGKPYAAKELEKRRFIKNGVVDQKVENEMKIMQRVHHPNIVRYMETIEWDDRLLIIIMEFVPGGDLGKVVLDQGAFPEDMVQLMSKQLLSALGYLHANNITHRDVKPDNILISSLNPLEVKLTDFGLSKMVDSEQTFLRTFCGTLLYCAPEVYTEYAEYDDHGIRNRGKKMRRVPGQRYNHAVDIWSLGGVLFYTLTGAAPYPVKSGISYSELLHKVMTTPLNISPLQNRLVSEHGIQFLGRMLQRRPEKRATVIELDAHPWLAGPDSIIQASQSYDEITDDEDCPIEPSQFRPPMFEEDRVSDSMDEDSEKENGTFQQETQAPRLFGEVGVSAIGSSGVIPDHLNLPVGDPTMGVTEIMDSHVEDDEAYDSGDSSTVNGKHRRIYRETTASISHNQSADQLQSLVADVASQSLGGTEPVVKNMGTSMYSTTSMDPNSSKRKPPPSLETSEEYDENTPPGKPIIKRLKSEGTIEEMAEGMIEEYKLMARMPQIRRLVSGRQIDLPVRKATYWEQDPKTWHLHYPEMTQLQHDAFAQAAKDRGEEFGSGRTPLWDLAMKYFPPNTGLENQNGQARGTGLSVLPHDDRRALDDTAPLPSTAAQDEGDGEFIPDTLDYSKHIVVPVQDDPVSARAVGMLDFHPNSCIQGTSITIIDSLISFGRGSENTEVFEPKLEPRVPKYAFKAIMWKDGYDPAKDPSKMRHPWLRGTLGDEGAYAFWISTKATSGININGQVLRSSDPKNPNGPSEYWTKVYDGDTLLIWGSADSKNQTTLVFRCFWGSSSTPRGANQGLELAPTALAQKLDSACQRTEKRIRVGLEKRRKAEAAEREHKERESLVERERERSRAFEVRRQEAVESLVSRQPMASRRGLAASAPATAHTSRMQMQTTQTARLSPDKGIGNSAR